MTAHVREVDVDWQGVAARLLQRGVDYTSVADNKHLQDDTRMAAGIVTAVLTGIGSAINNNLVKSPAIAVASDEDISGAVYAVLHDHVGTMTPHAMRDVADAVVRYVRRPE